MARLNELLKLANKVAENGSNASIGLNGMIRQINRTMVEIGKSFQTEQQEFSDPEDPNLYSNQEQEAAASQGNIEEVRRRDRVKSEELIRSINTVKKIDVFSFDITDERLVDGLIFSEILGKPVGRRRRHRHGRNR